MHLDEYDQLLVYTGAGYKQFSILNLLGAESGIMRGVQGMGHAPLHFITQRGPFQDGETVLDMRYDTRKLQLLVAYRTKDRPDYWDSRETLINLLRPDRGPAIYRKTLPGGKVERGVDLQTTAGSSSVVSLSARFVDVGGKLPGERFTITTGADAGDYTIVSVPNDYTLVLDSAMGATATGVQWKYTRGQSWRDLYILLEQGPNYDIDDGPQPFYPNGFKEALRFVAHDPFFYGKSQHETWGISGVTGDLIFNGAGAWFGLTPGSGRWVFASTYVSKSVSVAYYGSRSAKPIILVSGPANNPIISNTTTGQTLTLSYNVSAGETVTIDTLAITCQNNYGTNLLPYLLGDLASFEIAPDPYAPGGINTVSISFSEATFASSATLEWKARYSGI